ncbi:MAG: hypothetical protein NC299_09520 [Lachnospiraceae bacterium]|nr:hypothetical protein [Ruminococcus sp.]MCM1275592.1 hypothetical protein [Lachnospiraceae bacterium]
MTIIYIKSFTHARKAMSFLQKHGIRCIVERGFDNRAGCGFALKVTDKNASEAEVCALLGSIGVSCDIPR